MPNRRLLIVDDSVTIRAMIEQLFAGRADVMVVGVVGNAGDALEAMTRCYPDVITLDIMMPGMDGLALLRQIMAERPVPVIIVSSRGTAGSETSRQALALGASACFDKAGILTEAAAFTRTVLAAKKGSVKLH